MPTQKQYLQKILATAPANLKPAIQDRLNAIAKVEAQIKK